MKNYYEAFSYITEKHGAEYVMNHLLRVYQVVKNYTDKKHILIASLLHDIVEDTDVTLSYVSERFGEDVAVLVELLTDKEGKNRKERHEKTYPLIRTNEEAVLIKLADRYINVLRSPKGTSYYNMYKKEYKYFRDTLYYEEFPYQELWNKLDEMMEYKGE